MVNIGDVLAEIETDKASVEYHAEDAGTVARLLAPEGAVVDVGEPIAIFAEAGDTESDIAAAIADAGGSGDSVSAGATTATVEDAPSSVAKVEDSGAAAIPATAPEAGVTRPGDRIWASPIVRKMAKERGIDLIGVIGSGPLGRIVRRDIDLLIASGAFARAASAFVASAPTAPAVLEARRRLSAVATAPMTSGANALKAETSSWEEF
jgi:pyruvate dehydrogenase E2 component (dihydrolipoamide acetyltransferase)